MQLQLHLLQCQYHGRLAARVTIHRAITAQDAPHGRHPVVPTRASRRRVFAIHPRAVADALRTRSRVRPAATSRPLVFRAPLSVIRSSVRRSVAFKRPSCGRASFVVAPPLILPVPPSSRRAVSIMSYNGAAIIGASPPRAPPVAARARSRATTTTTTTTTTPSP